MRILGPIVLAQPLFMARRQSDLGLCRATRAELVSHQHVRREALFLEQPPQQFHRRSLVAPSLHKKVENLAFVVNRAPQPELPARNRHGHLVEMPLRRWPRASTAKFSSEQWPELQDPPSHRFVGRHRAHAQRADLRRREFRVEGDEPGRNRRGNSACTSRPSEAAPIPMRFANRRHVEAASRRGPAPQRSA